MKVLLKSGAEQFSSIVRQTLDLKWGGGGWFWASGWCGAKEGLSVLGIQGNTDSNSLKWLFGVSCIVLVLSSCICWGQYLLGDNRGALLYINLPGLWFVSVGADIDSFKC